MRQWPMMAVFDMFVEVIFTGETLHATPLAELVHSPQVFKAHIPAWLGKLGNFWPQYPHQSCSGSVLLWSEGIAKHEMRP
jgi:hypothetical protein